MCNLEALLAPTADQSLAVCPPMAAQQPSLSDGASSWWERKYWVLSYHMPFPPASVVQGPIDFNVITILGSLILMVLLFPSTVSTFRISNDHLLPSSARPTHPLPDSHYLLDSIEASHSRAPDYSILGGYAYARGRAQWYRGSMVVPLRLSQRGSSRQAMDWNGGAYPRHQVGTP